MAMRRRNVLLIITSFWLILTISIIFASAQGGNIIHAQSVTPTVTPTPGLQENRSNESNIPPALIGLLGVVIGAVITGSIGIFGIERVNKTERFKAVLQKEVDYVKATQQLDIEKEKHKLLLELEKAKSELAEEKVREEREQQQRESAEEKARTKMERARNNEERALAYREGLKADPRIVKLQVLEMISPLEVDSIYVRLRLHQEVSKKYELEEELVRAEARRDPNELIRAGFLQRENRSATAIDPVEAIEKYRRCVIVGDPGAGKTTLLKFLTIRTVNKQAGTLPDLPVLIELNGFIASGHQELLDYAAERWERRYGFPRLEARAYIEEKLEKGEALLLLDALDETVAGDNPQAAEEAYNRVLKLIEAAAALFYKATVVVTTGKAGYYQRRKLSGFSELEVLDFSREDIKQFIVNWFNCLPDPRHKSNAADLIAKLERNQRIQTLASNPILLTLITIVYQNQLDLPERRAELYQKCLETLLVLWDSSRQLRRRREFQPEHKRLLLGEIAWYFHREGRRYFTEKELLAVIGGFLPAVGLSSTQNGAILAEITAENGLIKEQAQGWYGFLHLTFQEYCAAVQAVEQGYLGELLEHRYEPWWEEVILLYAGRVVDAGPLLARLAGFDKEQPLREDIFCSNLIMAGRCLAARPTVRNQAIRGAVVEAFFAEIRISGKYNYKLAEVLAEIGGDEINKRLIELLKDHSLDTEVRKNIAIALGDLGEKAIATNLLELLKDPSLDTDICNNIALALGKLGEKAIATNLLELLKDPSLDIILHSSIAATLGKLGEKAIATNLLELLKDPNLDTEIRKNIAATLGNLGEKAIATNLLELLKDPSLDTEICKNIALALGNLGEKAAVPTLLELLKDPSLDTEIRSEIALALGRLREKSAIPILLELLKNPSPDAILRSSIAEALGNLEERAGVPTLLELLKDPSLNFIVQSHIALALGNLGEKAAVPTLLDLLKDPSLDSFVGSYIAIALGKLGEKAAVPTLLELLKDSSLDAFLRSSIAAALGNLVEKEEEIIETGNVLTTTFLASDYYAILENIRKRTGARFYWMGHKEGGEVEVVFTRERRVVSN